MEKNELETFRNRLLNIGIVTSYVGNYPWIYLDKVNGKKVKRKYMANHGFCSFWYTKEGVVISDITEVFKVIRETLCS